MKLRLLSLLLAAALLTSGCAYAALTGPNTYDLYFREADLEAAVGNDALQPVPIQLKGDRKDPEELAAALLERLLEGPVEESLRSTIPQGTTLLGVTVDQGQATVDLSAAYGTLSGVALTLADYAITFTLTQLEEVSAVKITVAGQELAYREEQVFHARDVLLSPKEDVVSTLAVRLYFPDQKGTLTPEDRVLDLYEGDTQVGAVSRALELGPQTKGLNPIFPEGFRANSLWLEENVCYVNLASALLGYLPEDRDQAGQVLDALQRSLCSLESVEEVRFLIDGEFYETCGNLNIG